MKIKVGFAYDSKDDYELKPGDANDKFAEFDDEKTISEIESALASSQKCIVERIGTVKNLVRKLVNGEKWDIVFNICEGLDGRNRESQVPNILEVYNIPYVGSDGLSMGLTLDKILAKKIAACHGVKTCDYRHISSISEIDALEGWIKKYPLVILKPSYEGTSKGITEKSICGTFEAARERAKYLIETYKQPILIEEFIKGYEFTVAIIGNKKPEVLPPVQISINDKTDLGDDFYTHRVVGTKAIKYICPADIDKKLDDKMRKLALESYIALGCMDFARIDIRVNYDFEPYFLECNTLPNLGLEDVFPCVAEATGRTYNEIITLILETGLKRHNLI